MTGYIKREDAYRHLSRYYHHSTYVQSIALREALDRVPAADVVERKVGKWCADYDYSEYDFDGSTPLPEPRKFQDGWQCSLCGGYSPSETNYCPNCGAKMEGNDA